MGLLRGMEILHKLMVKDSEKGQEAKRMVRVGWVVAQHLLITRARRKMYLAARNGIVVRIMRRRKKTTPSRTAGQTTAWYNTSLVH